MIGGQELIGGLDVRVNRNHFGRQVGLSSFCYHKPSMLIVATRSNHLKQIYRSLSFHPTLHLFMPSLSERLLSNQYFNLRNLAKILRLQRKPVKRPMIYPREQQRMSYALLQNLNNHYPSKSWHSYPRLEQ